MPIDIDPDEIFASRLATDWAQQNSSKFMRFMAEMDTPFWHMIMKDLMEKTFGPLK